MSVETVLRAQATDSGYQVSQVFAGLAEDHFEVRLSAATMSARETILHLSECYVAAAEAAQSVKHEWGTFVSVHSTAETQLGAMMELRACAVEALLLEAEKNVHNITEYILLHDAYHVGQIAAIRLLLGGWEPYSIYRM